MNNNHKYKIFSLIAVLVPYLSLLSASISTNPTADAIAALNKECIDEGLWSGAVIMAGDLEKVGFSHSYGWMDKARTRVMRMDALFDLASITKVVATASALAICIEQGKIEPDKPFNSYLPNYQGRVAKPVTVRSLARHISGFRDSNRYNVKGELPQRIMHHSPAVSEDIKYRYTCANCILLGLVVSEVIEMSLADFCADKLWQPMEMHNTFWAPLNQKLAGRIVPSGMYNNPPGTPSDGPARNAGQPIGNAGLFSTAADLAIFARMILNNGVHNNKRILAEDSIKLLLTKPDDNSPCSFVWNMSKESLPKNMSDATIGHTGWSGTSFWIDPVKKCYAIVLTNRTAKGAKTYNGRIALAELALMSLPQCAQ